MVLLLIAVSLFLIWLIAATGGVSQLAVAMGCRGPRTVDRLLRRKLDRDLYWVFRDVKLLIGSETLLIDHVVVSRFGVFVIETMTHSAGRSRDGLRRELSPLSYSGKQAEALSAFLGCDLRHVHPVVLHAGGGPVEAAMPPNGVHLDFMVPYLREYRDPVMRQDEVLRFTDRLLDQKDTEQPFAAGKER